MSKHASVKITETDTRTIVEIPRALLLAKKDVVIQIHGFTGKNVPIADDETAESSPSATRVPAKSTNGAKKGEKPVPFSKVGMSASEIAKCAKMTLKQAPKRPVAKKKTAVQLFQADHPNPGEDKKEAKARFDDQDDKTRIKYETLRKRLAEETDAAVKNWGELYTLALAEHTEAAKKVLESLQAGKKRVREEGKDDDDEDVKPKKSKSSPKKTSKASKKAKSIKTDSDSDATSDEEEEEEEEAEQEEKDAEDAESEEDEDAEKDAGDEDEDDAEEGEDDDEDEE